MTGEALLKAESLEKVYVKEASRVEVIKGLDLVIAPGETLAVVGSSGVGKSTLLHILGALEPPSSGRVLFRGDNLYGMAKRRWL